MLEKRELIDVRTDAGRLLFQVTPDGSYARVRVRGIYHEIDLAETLRRGRSVVIRVYTIDAQGIDPPVDP